MKTRDRILHTSLILFNEEGEAGTTTVDIANELDISPGNLYYHFKGKDSILAELFGQYEQSLGEILAAPVAGQLSVEDNWYYLYVVFEEMYNYRFLYHNLNNLIERYPDFQKRFRRMMRMKADAVKAVWEALSQDAKVNASSAEVAALVDNMVLLLTYWLTFSELRNESRDPSLIIHQGVHQLLSMIAPYLGDQQKAFYQQVQRMLQTQTRSITSAAS
ncbi:TetR/AcrR family transcriptional regulator [Halieaceae bacterium IMCC14734]|uniref:TetR/AcrR family transcriptional regulator n=1 Tax=Candidatus Litorirhabdus singularis TaxID=2518993 RepID=A0ABT3TB35_9GAMM|nr:TetR/AcrR family transcriptional regulator [Candidatus Litorirhabdus singularis]MCX2979492.1 TetR/AcrR family transcriptional regulator [Candidatus Litorirhabdus singularis]